MEAGYSIGESCADASTNAHFQLHNHSDYGILLFLERGARYVVEDKVYLLNPGNPVLVRRHELPRIYHNSPAPTCLQSRSDP